jgi:hypothetical protein
VARAALRRLRPTAGLWPAVGAESTAISAKRLLSSPRARAAVLGAMAIALPGFNDGAYYPYLWKWLMFAFGGAVVLDLVLLPRPRLGWLEWLSIGGLSAFLAWMSLSATWGVEGTEAARELSRGLVYLAALCAFVLSVERAAVRAFLVGLLVGITSLIAYGLYDKLAVSRPPDPFEGTLLFRPVGYANALGILAGMVILLAIGMSLDERHTVRKVAATGASIICAVGLPLTSSRGAIVATIVGLLVLLALRKARSGPVGRAIAGTALILLVAGTALWTVAPRSLPGLGDRPAYWHVAIEDATWHPLLGSGAGSFDDVWALHGPAALTVRDAHSLYLEVLAELGPVGLGMLGVALVVPLIAGVRARRQPLVPAVAAAYCAYLVHAGLDWDWEYPVVTLAGLACGAGLLVAARARGA